jgi:predicted metal-dependent HD superfamily phosphohydrolase
MPSIERWNATWSELGVIASTQSALFEEVTARYREPHRHYHTLQHLDECFAHLSDLRKLAEHPAEVELALWFHDAIYEVKRSDNEERSAQWARAGALAAGVPADAAERVFALIMCTRHAAAPAGIDAEVLIDIDLSILGASADRFDEYERQIREEYAWVPGFVFRRKRAEVLGEFLARSSIFCTPAFIERCEQSARANIQRSLDRLR